MASFDFIDAAARGYDFVWQERKYLARVAVPVIFVKVACLLGIFVLGLQDNFARQGLVLMPGYIMEALFVVGLIRYALYREAIFIWGKPVPVPESKEEYASYKGPMSRKQCVQGGFVMYMLLTVVLLGFSAFFYDIARLNMQDMPVESAQLPLPAAGGSSFSIINTAILLIIISASIWAFRIFWIYIPIIMGHSVRDFLKLISGMQTSVLMIATALICFLPIVVVFMIIMQIFSGVFIEESAGHILIRAVIEGSIGLVIITVQAVAMTYAFVEVLSGKKKQ